VRVSRTFFLKKNLSHTNVNADETSLPLLMMSMFLEERFSSAEEFASLGRGGSGTGAVTAG